MLIYNTNLMGETPKIKKAEYTGVKVTSILKALRVSGIKVHLTLGEQNKVDSIYNNYKVNKYILRKEMVYIWRLFWHYVLNDYRREGN